MMGKKESDMDLDQNENTTAKTPELNPEETEEVQIEYGSFASRVVAALVDLVLSVVILIPIFAITSQVVYGPEMQALMEQVSQDMSQKLPQNGQAGEFQTTKQVFDYFVSHPAMQEFVRRGGITRLFFDQIFQIVILASVFIIFWRWREATPGKMLVGTRVVDSKTYQRVTKWQGVIRFAGGVIAVMTMFLGFLWILIDKRNQGWHDKMAGTVVVKAKSLEAYLKEHPEAE